MTYNLFLQDAVMNLCFMGNISQELKSQGKTMTVTKLTGIKIWYGWGQNETMMKNGIKPGM